MSDVINLGLALAIGLLIGMERGWNQRDQPDGSRVAGVRTFGLLGLAGGVAGQIHPALPWLALVIAVAGAAIVVMGYWRGAGISATGSIAALLTMGLGALAVSGRPVMALGSAAVVTFLLASRQPLHGLLARMGPGDITAVARFAIIAAAILPLLPARGLGPFGAWNPRELWLVVVVVCGISFAAYVASRWLGQRRGTLVTAAIGGLYSSTAVTLALSRRLKTGEAEPALLAAGIAIASATMFGRVLLLTAILVPFALPVLALVIGPAALLALGLALWRVRGAQDSGAQDSGGQDSGGQSGIVTRNPFELAPALGFAALVALLSLLVRWAEQRFGDAGIATLLAITGSFDVDAAIVAMRSLAPGTLSPRLAGMILSLPVLINTLFKAGIVVVVAGWRAGWPAALALVLAAAAIPLGLVLLP